MVEQTKLIKIIKSYKELKESKAGELILVNGVGQLVIDPHSEYLKRFSFDSNKIIYTLSLEGDFFVQNHYEKFAEGSDDDLKPFMKTSCKKDSNTSLADVLYLLAKKEGLL
jgi:hypothetical protein